MSAAHHAVYFLHIYAKPRSHRDQIEHWIEEGEKYRLQLRIMAPPEGGKANKAIVALLAKRLDIAQSNITLISGATARRKTFKIAPWSALLAERLPKQTRLPTLF
ncbi:DUF167 domain-containing protein [Cardinium endosymbiont of Nabis limbatus]|uniref:DUF167 domain-containing protein n=1 Tax=Cardinium endosymbiont of Nabis limbatus TaxID=3066217 RepID=UPI003AF34628